METQKPKIAMYVQRTFGDKLNATFDFIKENWKVLLKYVTYLLLPVSLIQALSMNGLMGMMLGTADPAVVEAMFTDSGQVVTFVSYYGLLLLISLIGTNLLGALVYTLMRLYNEREQRLSGIEFGELKPLLYRNFKRLFSLTLFAIFMMVLIGLVIGVLASLVSSFSVLFVFLLLLVGLLLLAPLLLWGSIYLFEDISLMKAFSKAFRLGFATWGGVVLMAIVMGFLASILQGVTTMPWYISILVKTFFIASDAGSGIGTSVGYNFMLYLFGVLQAFGAYLAMIFYLVGLAYQYGHAAEKMDSVRIEEDINHFDQL
jgi:hypothetical protein